MSAEAPAKIAVAIGNVSLGPGATAILGTNNVGSVDVKAQEETAKRCKDVLFVSDAGSVRAELINSKGSLTEGTCQWIRRNETYRSWLDAPDSGLLWISGGPGRGKTMLSIFLTQEWEALPGHLFYVFCGAKTINDEVAILRSLLYQALDQSPGMTTYVAGRLGTAERTKSTLSSRGDLWAMFSSMLKAPELGPVLCLIDGLDECHRDSARWLLNNLRHVFDKASGSRSLPSSAFKLAIVSREMAGLRSYPRLNLETKADVIAEDVARVIDAKMIEHDRFSEMDDDFITEVKTTLRNRSDGTFLWVGFAIQELLSVETKMEMRFALASMPQGLGALYSQILLRIKDTGRETIIQLLRWVTLACHSLTPSELAGALNVDTQTILDLVVMSGSLLTLSERTDCDMPLSEIPVTTFPRIWGPSSSVVKFIHASVSDFLRGEVNDGILPPEGFRIHVEESELEITRRCLSEVEALLRPTHVEEIKHQVEEGDHIPFSVPGRSVATFSSYAIFFWPQHARRCGEHLERLPNLDDAFFQKQGSTPIWSRWWYAYNEPKPGRSEDAGSLGFSLLHVCSALGLLPLATRVLQDVALQRIQVDDPDHKGWTALCYALDGGHAAVAQLLVDHGASLTRDIQGTGWFYQSSGFKPIHKAMELGPQFAEPFLKKTLERISSNLMARWRWFRDTALEHSLFRKAVVLGDLRLLRILFANGATLNSDQARVSLEDALRSHCNVAIIELLLQHGASIHDLDLDSMRKGDVEVDHRVKQTLLNYGIDPDSTEVIGLLHYAVYFRLDIVELLLDRGAYIDALNYEGRPALFEALNDNDNIGNAAILLNRGAKLSIKDKYGETALHWAIGHRSYKGVELLLQHGMNVNIRNGDGETAWASVLKDWNPQVAELLLKYGVHDTFRGEDCGGGGSLPVEAGGHAETKDVCVEPMSLLVAVQAKDVQAAQLLLRHGADVDAQPDPLVARFALRDAITQRHVDMVRMLLTHGADPNKELEGLGTPLDWNRQFFDDETAPIAVLLRQGGGVYTRRPRTPSTKLRYSFSSISRELKRE